MDSNPLDGLLENATRDYPQQGNDVLMEWWAQEYGPRLLAVVKAAQEDCLACLDADDLHPAAKMQAADTVQAMSTAAEVPPPAVKYKPGQTIIHAGDCPCHACEDYAAMMREVQP